MLMNKNEILKPMLSIFSIGSEKIYISLTSISCGLFFIYKLMVFKCVMLRGGGLLHGFFGCELLIKLTLNTAKWW